MVIQANITKNNGLSALVNASVDNSVIESLRWVDSLPIATALYKFHEDNIGLIYHNDSYGAILQSFGDLETSKLPHISYMIAGMIEREKSQYFECWRSEEFISYRQLDINIAQYDKKNNLFIVSLFDKTGEENNRENLRREMMTDSLTGFCNRVGFEEKIEQKLTENIAIPQINHEKFAIIILDMARFSMVNQSVGTMAGDELILTIASRLNGRARRQEIMARLNGNEFALFMQYDGDDLAVEKVAMRLQDAFIEPCQLSDLEIQVECAAASAVGYAGQDDPMDILRYAQIALKKAKHSKTYQRYTKEAMTNLKHRFSIETDLRRALQRDELELNYQPLVDLETGKLNGFEALARWNHPDRGPISPIEFIPVAEESGLIIPLGRWALIEAARQLKEWDDKFGDELPVKMSVNMSAVQMFRDDVAYAVKDSIHNSHISGDRLTIELTESAFIDDPMGARKIMEALKSLDICIAMDDFGTGYSNLAYLQQLPIDVLKIDRSFVTDMINNKDKRSIVSAVLSLARSLGMQTTAEGIETKELSSILQGLGCSFGQGYYYSKPMDHKIAYEFLASDEIKSKF